MSEKTTTTLRLCAHIMAEGRQCESPALRLFDYCRHHRRYHNDSPMPEYARPALAKASQIPQAIFRGINEMLSGRLEFGSFKQMVGLFAKNAPRRPHR